MKTCLLPVLPRGLGAAVASCSRVLSILVWIHAVASAFAVAPGPMREVVSLRFFFLDETPGAYVLKTPTGYAALGESAYYVGAPVAVPAGQRLDLFKESAEPAAKEGGKVRRVKMATLAPPAEMSSALVVVSQPMSPSEGTPPVCSVEYIDNSPESFPVQSVRIVNLGRAPLATLFGALRTITEPGTVQVVHPHIGERNLVRTKAAVQAPQGWSLLYDNRTIIRPQQRVTVLCVYSPSGMKQSYDAETLARIGAPPPGHFWLSYTDVL